MLCYTHVHSLRFFVLCLYCYIFKDCIIAILLFYNFSHFRYRLAEGVTQFRVDEITGVIYKVPGVVFDREQLRELQITVIAYDGPGTPNRSSTVPVYITIKVCLICHHLCITLKHYYFVQVCCQWCEIKKVNERKIIIYQGIWKSVLS